MEQFCSEYSLKSKWNHSNLTQLKRIELEAIDNKFNCFDNGFSCQVVTAIGLGTLQGLISRAEASPDQRDFRLNEGFVLKRQEGVAENLLLSEKQLVYLLESLLQVGLFYQEKGLNHGDFAPRNISKLLPLL